MVVSDASYYIPNERKRIKVAKWGTPKKNKKTLEINQLDIEKERENLKLVTSY
jgi:hypothetical protein